MCDVRDTRRSISMSVAGQWLVRESSRNRQVFRGIIKAQVRVVPLRLSLFSGDAVTRCVQIFVTCNTQLAELGLLKFGILCPPVSLPSSAQRTVQISERPGMSLIIDAWSDVTLEPCSQEPAAAS